MPGATHHAVTMSGQHDKDLPAPVDGNSSTATAALISSKAPSSAGLAASADMETRGTQVRTTAVLSITFILERLDEQILTAVYTPIGASLHASPAQLGSLTLCRALVQALVSPLSGLLGDNCNRIQIVAAGTFLWGAMTAAIGVSTTLAQAMAWSAFNGIGLALVLPCVQSLVADYYAPAVRGRAFGFLFTMAALGGMAGGFFATSISGKRPGGIEGWRFAFYVVAALAAVAAVINLLLGHDPRPNLTDARGRLQLGPTGRLAAAAAAAGRACRALGRSLRAVLRIRTFQVLVLQGVVGGMPWTAMGYFTMWLQLLGFSNVPAAALTALFWGGTALGNFVGGAAGDALVKVLPDSGRQLTCQMSIATGLPLAGVLLRALPVRDGSGGVHGQPGADIRISNVCHGHPRQLAADPQFRHVLRGRARGAAVVSVRVRPLLRRRTVRPVCATGGTHCRALVRLHQRLGGSHPCSPAQQRSRSRQRPAGVPGCAVGPAVFSIHPSVPRIPPGPGRERGAAGTPAQTAAQRQHGQRAGAKSGRARWPVS
ncbi:probable quinolone resistance protein NorA at N-terminal half [Coccomyxa sp. Obi]|nr:probable quinolone resistance protein NorA at N-terminal half [Coccomyxa sp. Obi]